LNDLNGLNDLNFFSGASRLSATKHMRFFQQPERWNMSKNEVLNRFPAHRLEGALRFSAQEVRVGTEVPDFALRDLDGKTVRLSRYRGKSNVVLMFGSVTCGATATQLRAGKPSIRSLYARYKKKGFEFLLIYTKEPHPGENVPQPTTMDERVKNAVRLKQEEKVNFPMLIDTPDNAVRSVYRGRANGTFIVNKDGVLVFRSSWTHGPELAQVLYDLQAWEKGQARNELVRVCYSERLVGLLRNKRISASVHRRAGPQAAEDFAHLLDAEGKIG
jgi:glutathione peroxidase-family protein